MSLALVDGRQSEAALAIARGVRRLMRSLGVSSVTELGLRDGRRADIVGLGPDGELWIVEVKSCPADFRADHKWRDYAAIATGFILRSPTRRRPTSCRMKPG